jgi:hypothetical protein
LPEARKLIQKKFVITPYVLKLSMCSGAGIYICPRHVLAEQLLIIVVKIA